MIINFWYWNVRSSSQFLYRFSLPFYGFFNPISAEPYKMIMMIFILNECLVFLKKCSSSHSFRISLIRWSLIDRFSVCNVSALGQWVYYNFQTESVYSTTSLVGYPAGWLEIIKMKYFFMIWNESFLEMLNFTIWSAIRQTRDQDSSKLKFRARHPDIPEPQ